MSSPIVSALVKALLLVIAGKSFAIVWSSPNPPAKKAVRSSSSLKFFERNVQRVVKLATTIFWAIIGVDAVITILISGLFGPYFTNTTAASDVIGAYMCPSSPSTPTRNLTSALFAPSTALFVFTSFLAFSAAGRLWCYWTLGTQYRFEVSIQDKHHLVTSGPYAIVRHPGYFFGYGSYIGSCGLLVASGTWARECVLQAPVSTILGVIEGHGNLYGLLGYPITEYVVLLFMGLLLAAVLSCERAVAKRLVWEDGVLQKEFGKEWDEYAQRVPWRILPFVF